MIFMKNGRVLNLSMDTMVKYSSGWPYEPFIVVSVSFISWKCLINISNCTKNIWGLWGRCVAF
jgi:hypothetical protein